MSIALYQITADLRQQLDTLSDLDMSVQEAHDTLEAIQFDFESKVHAVVAFSRELAAEADFVRLEAKRMAERATAMENRAKSLQNYVLQCIQASGHALPIRYTEFTVNVAKNPPSVKIENEELIPKLFYVPQDPVLSKIAILNCLKDGKEVPGCRLNDPIYRLSVR
jgi:hypothetical protein